MARDDLGIVRLKGFVRLGDDALVEVHRAGRFKRIVAAEDRGQASRLVAIGPAARFDAARVQEAWEEAS
jgi:G3E family GTPase